MGSDWELQASDAVTTETDDDDLELSHLLSGSGAGQSGIAPREPSRSLLMLTFKHRSIACK